jgi:hypothetical protein
MTPPHLCSMAPNINHLPHPAACLLHHLATHSVPAPSDAPPWSLAQKDAAVYRGPYPSTTRIYTTFLLEDMYEIIRMGFWVFLPYSSLRHEPHLKKLPPSWCHSANAAHAPSLITCTMESIPAASTSPHFMPCSLVMPAEDSAAPGLLQSSLWPAITC